MKVMTCKQLGGACDKEFRANTFEELVEMSKLHGMEMFQQQDPAHMAVIVEVSAIMADPAAMQKFFDEKRALFNSLPEA